MQKSTNITWHAFAITPGQRSALTRVQPAVLWFTGLSGCGKSTLAMALEHALISRGHLAFVLDGDNVRHGLNKNLSFSDADRTENIRRIGEVAKLFLSAGVMPITAFISLPSAPIAMPSAPSSPPTNSSKSSSTPPSKSANPATPKTSTKKPVPPSPPATASTSPASTPPTNPLHPDLHLHSDQQSVDQCVDQLLTHLQDRGHLLPKD